jgi:hypothetical protein
VTSDRIDPARLRAYTAAHAELLADGGATITIDDLVGGADPAAVDHLLALYDEMFSDYPYLRPALQRAAETPGDRGDLVVHQLLLSIDGTPAGIMLLDCNLHRKVGIVLFVGLTRAARSVRIDGASFSAWLVTLVLAHLENDLATHGLPTPGLGLIGESNVPAEVRLWKGIGLHLFDMPYAEPRSGWDWAREELHLRDIYLLWMPPFGLTDDEIAALEPTARQAGSAAFFLDHYALPADHPLVAAAVGDEARRPAISSPRRA